MVYIFSNQKSQFGLILEGLAMEDVGIFYGRFGLFYCHLVYFTAVWSILLPFGLFYCHLLYFVAICYILWLFGIIFPFWYVVPRKIWQPWLGQK
jgi:hypothetical protein